jgi:hypothetical protein
VKLGFPTPFGLVKKYKTFLDVVRDFFDDPIMVDHAKDSFDAVVIM